MKLYKNKIISVLFSIFFTGSGCLQNPEEKLGANLMVFAGLLRVAAAQTTAVRVWGQYGSFTCGVTKNNGNCATGSASARNLNQPYGVTASGGLYILDMNNNRVLHYPSGSTTAKKVWGQNGSFTCDISNHDGSSACPGAGTTSSANNLSGPSGVALDASGGLYVSDFYNHRVLYYPSGSTTATRVYGQADFVSNSPNRGGAVAENTLNFPQGLALDGTGLYIADTNNHRVLYFPSGSTSATRVYGQADFVSNSPNPVAANTLSSPKGLTVGASGGLYISDTNNHRVLYFPSGSTTPSRVYGQAGAFNTNNSPNPPSADSLANPNGTAVDASGGLYIADSLNNRVLYYPSGSITATVVYGQFGKFKCGTANSSGGNACSPLPGPLSASNLQDPRDVAVDPIGGLYIADFGNNRVLYYPPGI